MRRLLVRGRKENPVNYWKIGYLRSKHNTYIKSGTATNNAHMSFFRSPIEYDVVTLRDGQGNPRVGLMTSAQSTN